MNEKQKVYEAIEKALIPWSQKEKLMARAAIDDELTVEAVKGYENWHWKTFFNKFNNI